MMHGIYAASGTPTVIDSNTINVLTGNCGIFSYAGLGEIVGNEIKHGLCGIKDGSSATEIAYNTIDSSFAGVVLTTPTHFHHNTLTHIGLGGGLQVAAPAGPIEYNTITNGYSGITVNDGGADFGGGSLGSAGGNTIECMSNRLPLSNTADTVWAQHNYWGTLDSATIDAAIWDNEEDATSGPVIFMPHGQ